MVGEQIGWNEIQNKIEDTFLEKKPWNKKIAFFKDKIRNSFLKSIKIHANHFETIFNSMSVEFCSDFSIKDNFCGKHFEEISFYRFQTKIEMHVFD